MSQETSKHLRPKESVGGSSPSEGANLRVVLSGSRLFPVASPIESFEG